MGSIKGAHGAESDKASVRDVETQVVAKDEQTQNYHGIDTRALDTGIGDGVYDRKVAVMNQALIDLGMGSFQWKIFALTGFGWFVDNVNPTAAPPFLCSC